MKAPHYLGCLLIVLLALSGFIFKSEPGMVWIPGGTFWMGSVFMRDARPLRQIALDGFWMDETEVTNEQFDQFVSETGYVTIAERKPAGNVPGSLVFSPDKNVPGTAYHDWWSYEPEACWRHPEGPTSNLVGREKHPVVHIAWPDVVAYAQWAGKRLPTEAEFEYAARGGLHQATYSWGDELKPQGIWRTNIWQGAFPHLNILEDGFYGTAPVGSFAPNGYGLYDMTGNVWEWCSDWYHAHYYHDKDSAQTCVNPQGPDSSYDPYEPHTSKKVQRGGSFLCHSSYCNRYLVGARGKGEPASSAAHIGFRCVKSLRK